MEQIYLVALSPSPGFVSITRPSDLATLVDENIYISRLFIIQAQIGHLVSIPRLTQCPFLQAVRVCPRWTCFLLNQANNLGTFYHRSRHENEIHHHRSSICSHLDAHLTSNLSLYHHHVFPGCGAHCAVAFGSDTGRADLGFKREAESEQTSSDPRPTLLNFQSEMLT